MRCSMSAVRTGLVLMALVMLAACSSSSPTTAAPSATPTICHGGTTPERGERPHHKSGSPERTSPLEPGVVGTPFSPNRHVLARPCQPIAAAVLDLSEVARQG